MRSVGEVILKEKGWVRIYPVGIIPVVLMLLVVLSVRGVTNTEMMFSFVQAASSVVMALSALGALHHWKREKIYNEKREISSSLDKIAINVESIGWLVDYSVSVIQEGSIDKDRSVVFERQVMSARRLIQEECMNLSSAQSNTFTQVDELAKYQARTISKEINDLLYKLIFFTLDKENAFLLRGSDYPCEQRKSEIKNEYASLKSFIEAAISAYRV